MMSTTISSLKSKVVTGDSLKSIYVISDFPKLNNVLNNNYKLMHFDLRTISRRGKNYIVSSDNPELLSYIKDIKDEYHITPIDNYLLEIYSKQSKNKVVHISECHCNIKNKKETCSVQIVSW